MADSSAFDCPRCGAYALSGTFVAMVMNDTRPFSARERAILSYSVRRMQRGDQRPMLDGEIIDSILKLQSLPTAAEQADNLLIWLGETLTGPGDVQVVSDVNLGGVIGALDDYGVEFIVKGLGKQELLDVQVVSNVEFQVTLSFAGWQRYSDLRRGRAKGLRAFMAMKFGNATLLRVYAEHFQPAARAAGFDLRKVNEEPSPGLIDNRIRVDILESRFIVADLSDDNLGAYWEAGYAEGLGKPVIYTCEKQKFNAKPTHFDTNHSLTIMWDEEDPRPASELLKATIRKTFPGEARMSDDATT